MVHLRKTKFVLLFLIIGCGHVTERAREEKRNGINGEAVYIFNKDNTLWGLFKPEYNVKGYQIFLQNDTINLGTNFKSYINVAKQNFRVEIISPSNRIITSDSSYGFKEYLFTPEREGVFDYRGIIEYDTTKVSFEYKFIVVKKD